MNAFDTLLAEEIHCAVITSLCQDLGLLPSQIFNSSLPDESQCRELFQSAQSLDVTASLVDISEQAQANVICKEACVFVGKDWVEKTFSLLDQQLQINWFTKDGQHHEAGETLFELKGNTRAILTGERTALNFAQTLSATATTVSFYADLLKDSRTNILDTRKTLPGLRYGQKYAVKCGGGENHRIGLYDRFLIKENHIMGCGSISKAVEAAKSQHKGILIEVEVENLQELQEAIAAGVDIVMLDNFDLDSIKQAVAINAEKVKLEVSGNIESSHLLQLGRTGVDYVSSGAITKHVQAIDLSLRLQNNG